MDITEVDFSIRRYRARFCNEYDLLHSIAYDAWRCSLFIKLTHYPLVVSFEISL